MMTSDTAAPSNVVTSLLAVNAEVNEVMTIMLTQVFANDPSVEVGPHPNVDFVKSVASNVAEVAEVVDVVNDMVDVAVIANTALVAKDTSVAPVAEDAATSVVSNEPEPTEPMLETDAVLFGQTW
ncbi:hypothetical protein Plhal304r1_c012g0048391 [Plasmopara halstedii]